MTKVMRFGDDGDVYLSVNDDLTLTDESLDKLQRFHGYIWDYIRRAPQFLDKCRYNLKECDIGEQSIIEIFTSAVNQYSKWMRRIKQGLGGLSILGGAYALNRLRRKQGSKSTLKRRSRRSRRSRRRRSRRR